MSSRARRFVLLLVVWGVCTPEAAIVASLIVVEIAKGGSSRHTESEFHTSGERWKDESLIEVETFFLVRISTEKGRSSR